MPKNFKPRQGAGDLGFTDLFGGKRVAKTDRRIKLNALMDDLSALLGLLKTGVKGRALKGEITAAQRGLLKASALVAGMKGSLKDETAAITAVIEARAAAVKPPREFVLPGANETEALAHMARAKARVCEILAWELKAKDPAVYLNRLSDHLFLVALSSK